MGISKVDRLAAAALTHAGATSFNTASITPVANRLLVLFVGANQNISNVSGCGLTWSKVKATDTGAYFQVWAAWTGPSPSSGALTITTGANAQTVLVFAYEFGGTYYDGDVANSFAQWGTEGHAPGAGTATCTLANSFAPDSWMINGILNDSNSTANITSDHNANKVTVASTNTGYRHRLGVQWHDAEDLSMTWTWSGSIWGCGIAAELLAAKSEFPKTMILVQN